MWGRRLVKIAHELGSVGFMGALAASVVLDEASRDADLMTRVQAQGGIAAITHWLLVPSLGIVAISGLAAIALNDAFINAGWPWFKALLGISMFEGTLLTVGGSTRRSAEEALLALQGQADLTAWNEALRTERYGIYAMLVLSLANIVLAVFRPRFGRASPVREPPPSPDPEA